MMYQAINYNASYSAEMMKFLIERGIEKISPPEEGPIKDAGVSDYKGYIQYERAGIVKYYGTESKLIQSATEESM